MSLTHLLLHALHLNGAELFASCLICACFLLNGLSVWQLVLAAGGLAKISPILDASVLWRRDADSLPPISLIAPAYNEQTTIVESVRSLLALRYPRFEILVVNDGSRDDTLKVLIEAFELSPMRREYDIAAPCQPLRGIYGARHQPRLVVVDKANGGKADALNAGINLSRSPIFCAMDADSLLERDALLRAVRPFVDDPGRTIAVGGAIRVVNGCDIAFGQVTRVGAPRNLLALLQTVEYLRAFIMSRVAWSRIGALTIISGAFGLFSREAVVQVGGYSLHTVGEDMELVVKLHKHHRKAGRPYRVSFVPEAVCWTEAPETLAVLGRQRSRWQRGALECLARHRDMLLSPRYGSVGVIGLGHVVLTDVIEPVAELIGLVVIPVLCLMGILSPGYMLAQLAVSAGLGVVVSVGALTLEESELRRFPNASSLLWLLGAAVVESFGYRQLNGLWRLRGIWEFARGAQSWGDMPRKGFARAA